LLRILIFLLLLLVVRALFARLFGTRRKASRSRFRGSSSRVRTTVRGRMVKDPQCGIYVATDLAVRTRTKDMNLYFCSEECRDKFLRGGRS
jgi:YHS domain-containing protein